MNLPFVFDIAIGLIFIYLILSLLASEIQEIVTTILQWRAEHLKKSIEVLLGGRNESKEVREAKIMADRLYAHPLIKDLNQEAKGLLASSFRKIGETLFTIYHKLTKSENVFGENKSGPSYIRPDFFAVTLMDSLAVRGLSHALSIGRVERFKQNQLQEIMSLAENANLGDANREGFQRELKVLGENLDKLVTQYAKEEISLPVLVDLIEERLSLFGENCRLCFSPPEDAADEGEFLLKRIGAIAKQTYGDAGRQVLLKNLKPGIKEVIDSIPKYREVYAEVQQVLADKNSPVSQGLEETFAELSRIVNLLPDSLKQSLSVLAKRAESKSEGVGDELNQLQTEIEIWFDRSMERASGVYKRNARGVAILIGFLVAAIANADTLYMVGSLSKDSVLRAAISQNAESLVIANPATNPEELDNVKAIVRQSLEDVSLPIGWNAANRPLNRARLNRQVQDMGTDRVPVEPTILEKALAYFRTFLGWLISGIAISMGASFWFDLLNKVVNIRNAGKGSYPSDDRSSKSV